MSIFLLRNIRSALAFSPGQRKVKTMPNNSDVEPVFVFGPFRLVPSRQHLARGNRNVLLGGRALAILHLLLMRAGEEVSTNDLIAFAWPNVFVDRSNLKVHISGLRRALEDTLPEATYIKTVVGHGYQFIGRVQTENANLGGDDPSATDGLIAASVSPVFTIARVAAMLGKEEEWLLDMALKMDPEAGRVTIHDVDDKGTIGLTRFGIDNLEELIEVHKEDVPIADRKLG